eukprot:6459515-Amphidinium_carterae.2
MKGRNDKKRKSKKSKNDRSRQLQEHAPSCPSNECGELCPPARVELVTVSVSFRVVGKRC